ncbi:MAG TPA: general stress protein [Polyangiaceae bacterium]|nr:general stress protein [Polyangiaceae bacterium]
MDTMSDTNCVAVFDRHQDAEAAIRALQKAGFDMKKLSIVGRDYHTEEHAVGFYNSGDRVKYWGKLGAFWGSVFGILFAPAFFWIPGVGPILTGGLIGSILMGTVEGAAVGAAVGGGASALAAGLAGIGIPKDSVIRYEADVKANRFLLIASGTATETERARGVLAERSANVSVHARH